MTLRDKYNEPVKQVVIQEEVQKEVDALHQQKKNAGLSRYPKFILYSLLIKEGLKHFKY